MQSTAKDTGSAGGDRFRQHSVPIESATSETEAAEAEAEALLRAERTCCRSDADGEVVCRLDPHNCIHPRPRPLVALLPAVATVAVFPTSVAEFLLRDAFHRLSLQHDGERCGFAVTEEDQLRSRTRTQARQSTGLASCSCQ